MVENEIKGKILCVDDEGDILPLYQAFILPLGYELLWAQNLDSALELTKAHKSELIIIFSDFRMEVGKSGIDLRKQMLADDITTPFVIVSGNTSKDMLKEWMEYGISTVIEKPFKREELEEAIEKFSCLEDLREEMLLRKTFLEEVKSQAKEIELHILRLKSSQSQSDCLDSIFRIVHTIKGGGRFLKWKFFLEFLQIYEGILNRIKNGHLLLEENSIATLLSGCYCIVEIAHDFYSGAEIDKQKYLAALDGKDAKIEAKASQHLAKIERSYQKSLNIEIETIREIKKAGKRQTELSKSFYQRFSDRSNADKLQKDAEAIAETSIELFQLILNLEKVEISRAFYNLEPLVHDLSASLQKSVLLKITDSTHKIHYTYLYTLNHCLIHIIRNCIDHGIENSKERLEKNKSKNGNIKIDVIGTKEGTTVTIIDDGSGLDRDKIFAKAKSKNLLPKNPENLSEDDIFQFIFKTGFSTAEVITDISGQGIGLDVVKGNLEAIGGFVKVQSKKNQGCIFTLFLPEYRENT